MISLIDGKPYKSLKHYLAGHGLTPAGYRSRYGFAATYPMVAPGYSDARRKVAKFHAAAPWLRHAGLIASPRGRPRSVPRHDPAPDLSHLLDEVDRAIAAVDALTRHVYYPVLSVKRPARWRQSQSRRGGPKRAPREAATAILAVPRAGKFKS